MSKSVSENSKASHSFDEVCSIRIELLDTDPLIWREVEVPTSVTLKVLHDIVQITMDWFDYHLWQFTIDNNTYGPITGDKDWDMPGDRDAMKTRLRDVLRPRRTVIKYLYDMGDNWEHRLIVTKIRQGESDVSYPRYIGGEWAAPPEDSGGIYGFYEKMDALAEDTHPDHKEIVTWLDGYDPKIIDELPIKFALGRIANRRKAGRVRKTKKSSAAMV